MRKVQFSSGGREEKKGSQASLNAIEAYTYLPSAVVEMGDFHSENRAYEEEKLRDDSLNDGAGGREGIDVEGSQFFADTSNQETLSATVVEESNQLRWDSAAGAARGVNTSVFKVSIRKANPSTSSKELIK